VAPLEAAALVAGGTQLDLLNVLPLGENIFQLGGVNFLARDLGRPHGGRLPAVLALAAAARSLHRALSLLVSGVAATSGVNFFWKPSLVYYFGNLKKNCRKMSLNKLS
jgi:hypothetical protein